jgi:hypothetical protein
MTDFGARPIASFGKRRPTTSAASTASVGRPVKPGGAAAEIGAGAPERYVPTKLVAILLAGVLVLIIVSIVGRLAGLEGPEPSAAAVAAHAAAAKNAEPDPEAKTKALQLARAALPFVLILIYQACHLTALYSMVAHFVLRWLRFSGLAAYTIGGLCAAFVVVSLGVAEGESLAPLTDAVELLTGALAGLFYRLFAGTVAVAVKSAASVEV